MIQTFMFTDSRHSACSAIDSYTSPTYNKSITCTR